MLAGVKIFESDRTKADGTTRREGCGDGRRGQGRGRETENDVATRVFRLIGHRRPLALRLRLATLLTKVAGNVTHYPRGS
jgi:hypothetical protein